MITTTPNGHGGPELDQAAIDQRVYIANLFVGRCIELTDRCRDHDPGIKTVAKHFFISGTRAVQALHHAGAADPALLALMIEALTELQRAIDANLDDDS